MRRNSRPEGEPQTLDELVAELRQLHDERDTHLLAMSTGDRGAAKRWLRAASRHDRLLIRAAEMVGAPAPRPPKVRRVLASHARAALQADLAAAGINLACDIAA